MNDVDHLGGEAAIFVLQHYPPPGAEPGSGISGQTLACSRVSAALGVSHVPKPLRLRGDETCVQGEGELAENRGPVTRTGGAASVP